MFEMFLLLMLFLWLFCLYWADSCQTGYGEKEQEWLFRKQTGNLTQVLLFMRSTRWEFHLLIIWSCICILLPVLFCVCVLDLCQKPLPLCALEQRQRAHQQTLQLEQSGPGSVTQAAEASVRRETVPSVRRGGLQFGRGRGGRRRRGWANGGWRCLTGQNRLHVTEGAQTQEDGVSRDSQLHGAASWCSAAGTTLLNTSTTAKVVLWGSLIFRQNHFQIVACNL